MTAFDPTLRLFVLRLDYGSGNASPSSNSLNPSGTASSLECATPLDACPCLRFHVAEAIFPLAIARDAYYLPKDCKHRTNNKLIPISANSYRRPIPQR